MTVSREIRLADRPSGEPKPSDFELAEVELRDPGPDEILVRNRWMSVDPYMRGRMNDLRSYVVPFELGAPLEGGAVGEVVASQSDRIETGQQVVHQLGWRDYSLLPAAAARPIDTGVAPDSAYLGVLGMPGLTAYVGLLDVAEHRDGDIVFVSGAAGAVGSLVGQLAKARGSRVIGSAGSSEKVAYLIDELGFDAAFNYRDGPASELLPRAAPEGIDVYFDNVGGEQLEAAISSMRTGGRIAMCGAISVYNATERPPGPWNLPLVIGKRLTLRGFIVTDHAKRFRQLVEEVAPLIHAGKIRYRESVVEGLENAPEAFIGLFRGENLGKMLVRIS